MNLYRYFLTVYFDIVQVLDCVFCFLSLSELYQSVALGLLCDMVSGNFYLVNLANILKIFTNMRFINMLHLLVINKSLDTYLTVSFLFRRNACIYCTGLLATVVQCRCRPAPIDPLLLLLVHLSLEFVGLCCPVLFSL